MPFLDNWQYFDSGSTYALCPAPEEQNSWIERTLGGALRGAVRGFKFGPGVLATIVPITLVGLPAFALVVWSLRSEPALALVALIIGLLFLGFVIERAFRYAEKNPIPALLGGSELLQLLRESSAKDPSIVNVDTPPVAGAGSTLIEGRAEPSA